jgi:transketolase
VAELKGPFYLRLGRYPVPDVFDGSFRFELGRARVLRQGKSATLIACGHMLIVALQAAELLANRGLQVEVINMSTIKPLDVEAVTLALNETPLIVTIEEHSIIGGLGSAVAEVMAEAGASSRLVRLGTRDTFGESGLAAELLEKHGLTANAVAERVRQAAAA